MDSVAGSSAQQSSLIGATIGNYRVVAKLGEGGMGSVYLAEHPAIGKKVAVKVLHEEYSANQDVVSRFFNEAKAVNDIQHPNIVDIIDYGRVEYPGTPSFVYFIMEFLGGESLSSLIQREAPLPPERAFAIAQQVADALSASHQKGIIHRDLKPDNIYLIQRGREKDFVKVLDFGIAKLTGDSPGSRRTRTGIVMGTPAYMSPEQCEGKGNIDARTDVYALGIVLYEMITGKVPFLGEGYGEILVQHLTKRPDRPTTPLGAVPPMVEAVIMRSLEKRREDRYETMEELVAALRDPQGFIAGKGGLDHFYQPQTGLAVGSQGSMSPGAARTPAGLPAATPGLGVRAPTPVPAVADDVLPAGKKKTPLLIAAGVAVVGIGVALAVVLGGGKKAAPVVPPPPVVAEPQVPVEPPKPVTPPVEPGKPATPAVAKIKVDIASDPPGAEIYLGDEAAPRGKTPQTLELDSASGQGKLTLRLEGYKPWEKPIDLSHSADLEARLDKLPATRPSGSKPSKPSGSKPSGSKPVKPSRPGNDDTLAPSF